MGGVGTGRTRGTTHRCHMGPPRNSGLSLCWAAHRQPGGGQEREGHVHWAEGVAPSCPPRQAGKRGREQRALVEGVGSVTCTGTRAVSTAAGTEQGGRRSEGWREGRAGGAVAGARYGPAAAAKSSAPRIFFLDVAARPEDEVEASDVVVDPCPQGPASANKHAHGEGRSGEPCAARFL